MPLPLCSLLIMCSSCHGEEAEVDVALVARRAFNPRGDELCFQYPSFRKLGSYSQTFAERVFTVSMLRTEAHVIVPNHWRTSESLNKLCTVHPSLNQMNTHIHLSNTPHFEDHCSSSSPSLMMNCLTSLHDEALMSSVTDSDAKDDCPVAFTSV